MKRVGTPDTFASSEDTNIPDENVNDDDRLFSLVCEITREWIDMATRCRPPVTPVFGSMTPGFGVNESVTW